jgi:hypothetical protein
MDLFKWRQANGKRRHPNDTAATSAILNRDPHGNDTQYDPTIRLANVLTLAFVGDPTIQHCEPRQNRGEPRIRRTM